ncbi:glycosyltransferase family 2 protein [Aliivibrio fischeri]|uniref:glycosyltransferase family 2 protein n=1 Tax=Aliivibrio fischeri TaxID=668 RepID=UPI0007C4FCD0|nr:glycosyltransferase family 2 protein [Aliivibrio fischeri]
MAEKVDIILATYNGEKYIVEQLRTILEQSYRNWHLYISDDGSSDNTLALIDQFIIDNHLFDKVTILPLRKKYNRIGPAFNFSYGLEFSTSKYIMFCDQDDFWLPEKIHKQISKIILLDDDIPALSFCDASIVDENLVQLFPSFSDYEGFTWEKSLELQNLIFQNIAPGCCMIFNDKLRELFLSKLTYNNLIMHDWYLIILCSAFGNINFEKKPLIKYRQHESNQVGVTKRFNVFKIRKKLLTSYRNHINAKKQAKEINELYNKLNINVQLKELVDSFNLAYHFRLKVLLKMKVKKSSYLKTLLVYLFI